MPTELGPLLRNPKVPDTRASCLNSPSPRGALGLVLSVLVIP